jgi:hypothetical protein
MRAAGLQMVFGLRDPKTGRGETTIIDMLPKKRNPPPFSKRISEPGFACQDGIFSAKVPGVVAFLHYFGWNLCGFLAGLY